MCGKNGRAKQCLVSRLVSNTLNCLHCVAWDGSGWLETHVQVVGTYFKLLFLFSRVGAEANCFTNPVSIICSWQTCKPEPFVLFLAHGPNFPIPLLIAYHSQKCQGLSPAVGRGCLCLMRPAAIEWVPSAQQLFLARFSSYAWCLMP
jgi:hypothetical protein